MTYYSGASTFRKEQALSSRYNTGQQLHSRYISKNQTTSSRQQSTTRNIPSYKQTILHQEQITDLQRKIDLILMHNEKLQSEKQRYRQMYEQLKSENNQKNLQSNTARFIGEENQYMIQKLRRELQFSANSYENKLAEAYEERVILKQEIETLSKIIEELNRQNKELKLSFKEQSLKVESLSFELKEQFIRQQTELQNKLRDEFLIREIELKNERKQLVETYEHQVNDLKELALKERQEQQAANETEMNRLKEQLDEEKLSMVNQQRQSFSRVLERTKEQHREQLKKEQDKAIEYINQNITNIHSQDQQIREEYEQEINRLRDSLESRKRIIDSLVSQQFTSAKQQRRQQQKFNHQERQQHEFNFQGRQEHQFNNQGRQEHQFNYQGGQRPKFNNQGGQNVYLSTTEVETSWLPQLIALKDQLSQQTNHFLQQSQLLKLKLTEKFQIDIKSLKSIYENKIELMALHNHGLEQQNTKLRDIYEKLLHDHIQAKKDFELQKSKLKNVVRKLNVELHGIQEEFKLNIEGVRDMNNTFSMTMMKSMIEVKEKANFYSEENRKLRRAYEQHETETHQAQRQANQKVLYYQSKFQNLKEKYNLTVDELKQQLELTQQQAEQRETQLRDNLNKQHEMIHSIVQGLRNDLEHLAQQNDTLKKHYRDAQASFKDRDHEIATFKSLVSELQADIQRLKLDLSMAGVDDKNHTDTINQWKNHYQTTIAQLEDEKDIIRQKLSQRDQQLAEIIKRYKLLEGDLAKVVKTLKKRSHLDTKVVEVGMDVNLVKNLAQLFGKENQENGSA